MTTGLAGAYVSVRKIYKTKTKHCQNIIYFFVLKMRNIVVLSMMFLEHIRKLYYIRFQFYQQTKLHFLQPLTNSISEMYDNIFDVGTLWFKCMYVFMTSVETESDTRIQMRILNYRCGTLDDFWGWHCICRYWRCGITNFIPQHNQMRAICLYIDSLNDMAKRFILHLRVIVERLQL